jgi:trigger factor
MKKALALFLILALGSAMILTGCGSEPYDYDLTKYIKVGEYKGLEYENPDKIKVSDKEIKEAIKEDLEEAKALEDVEDGKVHDGDTVNIDYTGKVDGEEFEGGSAEGSTLEIGSGTMIDGFEDGLVGAKVGETVTLELTFPDPYDNNEDLSGKDVVFEVTVNSAQEYVTPTEEEYVEQSSEYDSVSDYEKAVKNEIYQSKEDEQQSEIETYLWGLITDSSEVIEYPEKELDEYKTKQKEYVETYAKNNSMEYTDVIESTYGMTEEEFDEELDSAAKTNAKEQMIVYYIARQEGLEVTNSEYKDFVAAQLESIGYTAKEFEDYTGSSYEEYVGGEEYIKFYMLYEKVMDLVVENAKGVDELSTDK